jgi:hypothetical protein
VIMERRRIVSEAQWVHIKKLMGVHYDWNIEVIAQFYATLFIEEAEDVRAMRWMTEGEWYHITFDEFATQF